MAALAADRATPALGPHLMRGFAIAEDEVIYKGALVAIDAAGELVAGAEATGLTAVGVAITSTAQDPAVAHAITGTFLFGNSAAADAITAAEVGATCYIVDDQTVAKTSDTDARSAAGKVHAVTAAGVWVTIS